MALLAKLCRRHCTSGEGEDSENRALDDPFIETQRCFCLQHRGLEPEENEQLVEPLLNEFPRMRKKKSYLRPRPLRRCFCGVPIGIG
jgi:hypothetical protein